MTNKSQRLPKDDVLKLSRVCRSVKEEFPYEDLEFLIKEVAKRTGLPSLCEDIIRMRLAHSLDI